MARVKVEAFIATNKATIKGKIGHTRTGACTSKGRCQHGMRQTLKRSK